MTKTQQALISKAQNHPHKVVSVVYASSGVKGGKSTFGLRDRAAALKLVELGVFERVPEGCGNGCMTFKLV